jgi:hypothetical protein
MSGPTEPLRDPVGSPAGRDAPGDKGNRTNEEVVGIRRPLPASIFGCGGVQPAVLAAVERGCIGGRLRLDARLSDLARGYCTSARALLPERDFVALTSQSKHGER